jgi:cytochrome P450 family 109
MIQRPATMDQLAERMASFEQLRKTRPVFYDVQNESWHVFRYDDVLQVLTETSRFAVPEQEVEPGDRASGAVESVPSPHLLALLAQALPPRMVHGLAPRIVERAQTLLERIRPSGEMDVIGDLAAPLSASVLADLFGIPVARQPAFLQWVEGLLAGRRRDCDGEPTTRARPPAPVGTPELSALLAELLEQRRREGSREAQRDLIDSLVTASSGEDPLSVSQLTAGLALFLEVGYAAMVHLLGNAVLCLAAHPDVVEQMHRQPAPVYSTVEEVLRYLPPIWAECRTTTTDVQLDSERIPARSRIYAWIVSANRDASQFAHPDRFDIERIPNRHLSLRHGLYAQLAGALPRLEATTAIPLLLKRRLVVQPVSDLPLAVVDSPTLFGVKRLPITLISDDLDVASGG